MGKTEFFAGGLNEMNEMAEAVNKRDGLLAELRNIVNEGKKLEKELEDLKKSQEKEIADTVQMEREKEVAEENHMIREGGSRLKQVRNDRNKAKEQGVKNRIENETIGMIEENRSLHRQIRKSFHENGLPSYCDTKWFYTLYCTQSGIEWLIKIIVFLAGFVIIPGIVVAAVNPWWFFKIIIWAVCIVVFIAVYMTIYLVSKDRDNGVLEEMREQRDKIADNERKIKSVKKGIRTDNDESYYNLGEFDSQITQLEQQIEYATKVKTEKLNEFEQNKKQGIVEEVSKKHAPVLEEKQNVIKEKLDLYNQKNNEYQELEQKIVQEYETYLTKPYTNAGCLKRMQEFMQNGTASTIGEAFNLVK